MGQNLALEYTSDILERQRPCGQGQMVTSSVQNLTKNCSLFWKSLLPAVMPSQCLSPDLTLVSP